MLKAKLLKILHHPAFPWVALAVLFGIGVFEAIFPHPVSIFFQVTKPENIMSAFGPPTAMHFAGFSAFIVALWVFNYLLAAGLGFTMLSLHPGFRTFSVVERWLSGFWLGYLGVCAISRLWSCFTFGGFFYTCCLVTIATLLWVGFRERLPRRGRKSAGISFPVISAVATIIIAVASLIQLIYHGQFQWVGRGYNQYARHMLEWDAGLFPILDQHYDEFVFHHFLTAPLFSTATNPLIPWWITLGLIKASTFAFFLLAAQVLQVGKLAAFLLALFLFIGTVSIPPTSYYLLYDSSHPLLFTAHSGRVVGIPLFIFCFSVLRDTVRLPAWVQVLLGGGIVATSFSNVIWLFVLIAFFALRKVTARKMSDDSKLSLIATPLLYILPAPPLTAAAKIITGLAVWPKVIILFAHFLRSGWISSWKGGWRRLKGGSMNIFALTAAGFALLFGNMLAGNPIARLFRSAIDMTIGNFAFAKLAPSDYSGLTKRVGEIFFDQRELDTYIYYNESPFSYLAVYGGLFLLIGLAMYAVQRKKDLPPRYEPEARLFYFLVFLLPFLFVFIDFFGFGAHGWVRSRFMEIPFYVILFVGATLCLRLGSKRMKNVTIAFLAVFSVLPFIWTERISQLHLNFDLLMSILRG